MTTFAATLGGTINLNVMVESAQIAQVVHNMLYSKGSRRGVPVVQAVDNNDVRSINCQLVIYSASKTDAIAQIAAINALLRNGTTLALTTMGGTNTVTFNVMPSPRVQPDFADPMWENTNAFKVPATFIVEPYAYGPETTIYSGSPTYPATVDFTVPGDYKAPLSVTMTGTGVHCVYMGLFPDQTVALPLVETDTPGSWSGGTEAAGTVSPTYAHGGAYVKTTAGTGSLLVADTTLPVGSYRMLGRINTSAASNSNTYYVGSTVLTLTAAGWTLLPFGSMSLPYVAVKSGGASSFQIGQYAGGAEAWFDYVGMCPTTWGWAQWAPSSGAQVSNSLLFDYDGRCYDTNVVVSAPTALSDGLMACGAQRLVVFADTAVGSGASGGTISLTTTIKAIPRYALWA